MTFNIKSLPASGIVKAIYDKYYIDSPEEIFVSSHWKRHSGRIRVNIDNDGNITELLGSGFGLIRNTHLLNKMAHAACNMSYLLRLPDRSAIRELMEGSGSVLRPIDAYLSYECFRQLYSLNTIMRHLSVDRDEPFNVLMIGDGYGFLSAMIKTLYPGARITLVDIGKVLLFQAVYLQRIFPDRIHAPALCAGDRPYTAEEPDFIYCPSENIESLGGARFKLAVNIASMQEMNYPTIEMYFSYIRSHTAENGLFYCCNRQTKELPGGELIEFTRYPWKEEDRHIVDEECRFYRYHLSPRTPFYHRFDGPLRHRLSALEKVPTSRGNYQPKNCGGRKQGCADER